MKAWKAAVISTACLCLSFLATPLVKGDRVPTSVARTMRLEDPSEEGLPVTFTAAGREETDPTPDVEYFAVETQKLQTGRSIDKVTING
ncbi:MAG: hypothetical protein PVJ55_04275, partial [Anaerolineae bacterium]